jgi:putative transposase
VPVRREWKKNTLFLRESPVGQEKERMQDFESLAHVRWECKYHVDFIPKYRRKVLYGRLRSGVGRILRDLCEQKKVGLLEGHALSDHVHLCLSIPPKYSVAYTIGFLKGKSAVRIHRELTHERRMTGLHFWAAGYWVSTVGRDEATVRKYIRDQENWDRNQGQLFE